MTRKHAVKMQNAAFAVVMIGVIILPACVGQSNDSTTSAMRKCDDRDELSKKCPPPCTIKCLPTMNVADCEVNLFTVGLMDMTYATSFVPSSLGEPWEDAEIFADGSLQVWLCSSGSLSNGTAIPAFTLVLYSVSIVTNASLPNADFNGRMSTLVLTDSTVVANYLQAAGAHVVVTSFTTNWTPGTLVAYAPMTMAASGHFQLVREGSFNNQANVDWPYQFFTKAGPATWFQFHANQTWQSLPTVLHLDSQDAFWAHDPTFGGHPVSFEGYVSQVATATFRVESL